MQINSANQPAYADKTSDRLKTREAQETRTSAAKAPGSPDDAAKPHDRDAFIPSAPPENNGIYKPPAARQAEASPQADSANDSAKLSPKPQISEILAKIKAATPDELMGAHQKAASENIAALLEDEE